MTRILTISLALFVLVVGVNAQAKQGKQKGDPKTEQKAPPAPTLASAQGTVGKADRESLTVKPRDADGRFGKDLVLQVTGTSKVTTLSTRMQAGKQVMVQTDSNVADLQGSQAVAVIYAESASGMVLLSAVALPK